MCSGCSGYFEGDGDETGSGEQGQAPHDQGITAPGRNTEMNEGELDLGEYEVTVSENAIIERHRIRANRRVSSYIPEDGEPTGWLERRALPDNVYGWRHGSWDGRTAKHYRALAELERNGPSGARNRSKRLIFSGLLGIAAIALAFWLAAS